jgi:hypothetical protein
LTVEDTAIRGPCEVGQTAEYIITPAAAAVAAGVKGKHPPLAAAFQIQKCQILAIKDCSTYTVGTHFMEAILGV